MVHLITLATIDHQMYVYDFTTEDRAAFEAKKAEIQQMPDELKGIIVKHVMRIPEKTFAELRQIDPYFRDAKVVDQFSDLMAVVKDSLVAKAM